MPAEYDAHGIRFLYPENWTVVEADEDLVSLESEEGAIWTLARHPLTVDPEVLNQTALETMQGEESFKEFEATVAKQSWGEVEATGFDVFFSCLDLIVAAQIRSFRHEEATYFVLSQGESRDFDRLEPVFNALTTNLLQTAQGDQAG